MDKRHRLASAIVALYERLAKRSVRFRLLVDEVVERLFLTARMRLEPAQPSFDLAELAARTAELNAAAEAYFATATAADRAELLDRPYSDRLGFARRMFDVGVLVHWLRLSPGEVVAELGAGGCWLSHLLHRFGCRTIAVDVSKTALALGRERFERDPQTDWQRAQFLDYDGRRLPLGDASVDKLVIYDAFHHIPNQEEILREMARVLRRGGIAAMSEPGRHHAEAESSRAEVARHQVLENDIFVEELDRLARRCGFRRATVVPLSLGQSMEIPAAELDRFLQGVHLKAYWERLATALVDTSYIVLYKGEHVATTRHPQTLRAAIEPLDVARPLPLRTGETGRVRVRLRNEGDTRWLGTIADELGWTRLGARLHRLDADGAVAAVERDWYRAPLPGDVDPGEEAVVELELPPLTDPGDYRVVLDLVAEQVAWFSDANSPTSELPLRVTAS